ncbi:hypothetical protein Tco_0185985, partial [Tanacetum coccineum]
MKIKSRPNKRKANNDFSTMECEERDISKKVCTTSLLPTLNAGRLISNSGCLRMSPNIDRLDKTLDNSLYALANANNNVNEIDLFCIKNYKNKNDLQKEGPIDKAVGLNIGLPLGNAISEVAPSGADFTIQNTNTNNGLSGRSNKRQVTATNVDIIDPYSLQACDIL